MKRRLGGEFSEDESSSSDDSIDLETLPSASKSLSQAVDYGLGASLMARMGYTAGQGLGAQKQGILDPVEQIQRHKNVGIGATNAERKPDKVISAHHSESTSKTPEERARLAKEQQLIQLKQIEESLSTLTSTEFINKYSKWPIWDELKLWDAVFAKATIEFREVQLDRLVEYNADLTLIESVLPTLFWEAFIQEIWSLKFSEYTKNASMDAIVSHLELLRELLPQSVTEFPINEHFLLHCHVILADPVLYNRVLRLCPRYFHLIRELIPIDELSMQELIVLELVCTKVRKLLQCEPQDLNNTRIIIDEWSSKLDESDLHLLLDQFLVPLWKKELKELALINKLTQKWWLLYKPYIRDPVDLLWGLNAINQVRDIEKTPDDHILEKVSLEPVTLRDVIEHYCYVNSLKCQFNSENTGAIQSGKRKLDFEIRDGVLYDASSRDPMAIESLKHVFK